METIIFPALATLRSNVEIFFEAALRQCAMHQELDGLGTLIRQRRQTIADPMRVAFVGKTNGGKSTMLNAFLGAELASMGNFPLTFRVTVFRYGDKVELFVHKTDGSREQESFESLDLLTRRCKENEAFLNTIRYVEVTYPNPLLKRFCLIDTPGLQSFYENDSQNTKDLLESEDMRPHAVVFLMQGAFRAGDISDLENFFLANSNMNGMTAVGVLTKVDSAEGGIDGALRIIRQGLENHDRLRRDFYTILPTAGVMAFGAQTITETECAALKKLAQIDNNQPSYVSDMVSYMPNEFTTKDYPDIPEFPECGKRKALLDRLGAMGIVKSIELLKSEYSMEQIKSILMEESRIGPLRDLVVQHFGNRAYLLKAMSALDPIRQTAFDLAQRMKGDARACANRIAGCVDEIIQNEQRFAELEILGQYYRGQIKFMEEELTQLLQITGEYGMSCAERLGCAKDTPLDELLRIARDRQSYWSYRGNAFDSHRATESFRDAARTLAVSHTRLTERIEIAKQCIERASILLSGDDQRIDFLAVGEPEKE